MKEYNFENACWQTCSNCTYCNKGQYKFGQELRENNPKNKARRNWYCEGWEDACANHADDPTEECCDHWDIY